MKIYMLLVMVVWDGKILWGCLPCYPRGHAMELEDVAPRFMAVGARKPSESLPLAQRSFFLPSEKPSAVLLPALLSSPRKKKKRTGRFF